jgi:hypothetical protein
MQKSRWHFDGCGVVLLATLIWITATVGAVQDARDRKAAREVVLTQGAPHAVFPLDEQRVIKRQTTVVVRLLRQENPDRAAFSVSFMLAGCHGGKETHVVPVGSLGTYPSGQTEGSYAFDIKPALQQMRSAGFPLDQICVKLELKPLRASVNWKRLRVTVTSPEWKQPPAN